jgi:hypothetical protein
MNLNCLNRAIGLSRKEPSEVLQGGSAGKIVRVISSSTLAAVRSFGSVWRITKWSD